MSYEYYVCDVFTDTPFSGNQLGVIPNAVGLNDHQMQKIAREFNYSESTFVFPAEEGHTHKVRIFTPMREVPFAGHPNVGTAYVLAATGELGEINELANIVFEEKAGLVDIEITQLPDNRFFSELKAPEQFSLGITVPAELMAKALSLSEEEIVVETHIPQLASVGLPFVMVELRDKSALERAKPHLERFQEIADLGIWPVIHLYVKSNDAFDLRTRMFAPLAGIPEDPATGSANCALTGLLAHFDPRESGQFEFTIAQGVEMGRPSKLKSRAEKNNGNVVNTWIGGEAVITCKGTIYLE